MDKDTIKDVLALVGIIASLISFSIGSFCFFIIAYKDIGTDIFLNNMLFVYVFKHGYTFEYCAWIIPTLIVFILSYIHIKLRSAENTIAEKGMSNFLRRK